MAFDGGCSMRHALRVALIAMLGLSGCETGPQQCTNLPPGCVPEQVAPALANPVFIPIADNQCAWEQVVDVVNDYFRIEREEPVRAAGNMVTEGHITTMAEVSPTIFEPWRRDTGDPPQRMENTLQSMRRRAIVRVVPTQGGHWVEFTVYKELENVIHPEHATAGAATFRYDSTLTRVVDPIGEHPITKNWIPQGRDASLEQSMIRDLVVHCGQASVPPSAPAVTPGPLPGPMPGPVPMPMPAPGGPTPAR
jgi:hypothetical protein